MRGRGEQENKKGRGRGREIWDRGKEMSEVMGCK